MREADPNVGGLKRGDVARKCVESLDWGVKTVFMPGYMRYGFPPHIFFHPLTTRSLPLDTLISCIGSGQAL